MKETKVYVKEMPEYCDECPCSLRDKDDCAYCNLLHKNIGYDFGKIPKHCPLQLIKDHDRELVKEVCEKIKLKFSDTRSHNWGVERIELYEFLDQIQKEAENE